jgi:UDP-N-acetylmuramoyl-tripeptide--D-alanyl-D-alanine ligase
MGSREKSPGNLTLGNFVDWGRAASRMSVTMLRQKVAGAGNDSRKIGKGDVFVALTTDKDDGHRYVSAALKAGASAALVARKKLELFSTAEKRKLIPVDDPLCSLQRVAACYREKLGIPMIGITGSSGKTTARLFVASVLKQGLRVGETEGNLNNHIGVPLSLLRFTGSEDVGVLEMGANHTGEIHTLSTIVKPTIGIITSIGYAHIGYFGSLKNILKAKFEIIDGMDDTNGFLMLCGDDRLLVGAAKRFAGKVVFFGFSPACDFRATDVRVIGRSAVSFSVGGSRYHLSTVGRHFIYSALLAIYLGRRFGIDDRRIAAALRTVGPADMRGTIRKRSGATFILDCYNANPSSMKSGIGLLCDVAGSSRKVAVVGDMLELGKYSRTLHYALGKDLARAGVAALMAVGNFASIVADGARSAGVPGKHIQTSPDSAHAVAAVRDMLRKNDVVLFKGSRGVHLETIYDGIARKGRARHASAH